ncbi:hypothetical protein K458DRAFT_381620 [Lentithecium fluviatile CBS 122367]|uniref:DUF7702 domain-containing protein n=1 Tax=Lentithecium fluviatile CBS 122367 TaxID=1168545 RepID=A0A6G1JMX6_9PLEO|nr:hypothetical protein K458DRAFT_381620 [Lentithecium fluviatile CBS 122367]
MSPHDALAIAELVIYGGTALPIGLFLWVKEGWRRFEWMCVFLLASVRIIGSILQLKDDETGPPNKSIAIVNGIGLSPLIGITLMLVHRLCKTSQHIRLAKVAILLHVVVFGAVPLLVVGILKLFSADDGKALGRVLTAIGLAIFLQVYLVQTFLALYAYKTSAKQKPLSYLVITIFVMTPLLLLRLLYSALAFFVTSSKTFSPSQGSMAAQVLLSIVPENSIALLAVGWGLLNWKREPHGTTYELTSWTTS